jgi:hypothetical protein
MTWRDRIGIVYCRSRTSRPEGIVGFVDALDMSRVEEVRLADCFRNDHYANAFGTLDDMLAGRDELVGLSGLAESA